tara:strand:+ start:2531 stop:3577 length:1047 start_codon:yes stop_codon:yes gene_type:complete
MNLIEREILRAMCYYNFYNTIVLIFKRNFNIDDMYQFKLINGYYGKIRQIIIRWIFILVMVRTYDDDPIFITQKSTDLENQIKIDINTFFKNNNPNNINLNDFSNMIIITMYSSFKEYKIIINTTEIYKDNKVLVEGNKLTYSSKSIKKIFDDPYVMIYNKKIILIYHSDPIYLSDKYNINTVFATYFRYKYLFTDNQTLAYTYTTKKDEAIECFSTPFNHHHIYFCSAFPDLELGLGSHGEFFDLMNKAIKGIYKYPVNILKINPIFDEIVDLRVSEISLKLLDTKEKYEMNFILPNWTNFKAVDILLQSKYFTKKEIYKKGDLFFTNYFTGKKIPPCDIIIIYLQN